jgi:hypothetical protein
MFNKFKREKYPERYVDLCKFVNFYNEMNDFYTYNHRRLYLQVSDKDWTIISLEQEQPLNKILKFMSEHPEARKTAYIEDTISKEKDIKLTKQFRKLNIDYKKAYNLITDIDSQLIPALDETIEKQYSTKEDINNDYDIDY